MPDLPASKISTLVLRIVLTAVLTGTIIGLTVSMGQASYGNYRTPLWALVIHLGTVIPAVPLGAYVLLRKKGDALHRLLGKIWASLMIVTSVVSFWVRGATGNIGPIHIFSIVTLISIPLAIYHIRNGNVARHKRAMTGPYIGLCIAGLFAMAPGRMLGQLIFG
jgi:uncharacterized membrane protein